MIKLVLLGASLLFAAGRFPFSRAAALLVGLGLAAFAVGDVTLAVPAGAWLAPLRVACWAMALAGLAALVLRLSQRCRRRRRD